MVTPLPDHVQRLAELGLSNSEERVYLALLGRDAVTASEAAQLTGLPRQRLYNLLRGLQLKGLCLELPGPVLRYRACGPDQALTGLLVDRNREFQAKLEQQQRLAEALAGELQPLHHREANNGFPGDVIRVLHNPNQILREYNRLLLECREEFLAMARLPYVQAVARPTYEQVAEGVSVRFLIEENLLVREPRMVEAIFRRYGHGEHRFLPALPLKLYIFDRQRVKITLPHDGPWGVMAIVLESPEVAAAQRLLFEGLWEQATPAEAWRVEIEAAVQEAVA